MAKTQPDGTCLQLRCSLSVPKDVESPNEDCYQCSARLNVYAICDGASISYDSALWSKILARRFCRSQRVNREWLLDCIGEFTSKHDRESLPWAKQAAFDRGSFSSLLGVVIDHEANEVRLLAVGDTAAFLYDGNRLVWSCPYEKPEQFDASPSLLSTNLALNTFDAEGEVVGRREMWSLAGLAAPTLLCMTDALAKWLLEQADSQPSPLELFRSLSSRKALNDFVVAERATGRLRKDDSTFLGFW